MKQNRFWHFVGSGNSRLLWNSKVYCNVHNSLPFTPSWTKGAEFTNLHPIFLTVSSYILRNSTSRFKIPPFLSVADQHLYIVIYAVLIYTLRATFFLYLITLMIFALNIFHIFGNVCRNTRGETFTLFSWLQLSRRGMNPCLAGWTVWTALLESWWGVEKESYVQCTARVIILLRWFRWIVQSMDWSQSLGGKEHLARGRKQSSVLCCYTVWTWQADPGGYCRQRICRYAWSGSVRVKRP